MNDLMRVSSPCNSVCKMDKTSSLCLGCWRTIDEIIAWSSYDDMTKIAVWLLIDQRKIEGEKEQ
jgi:uncharacterized protein